MSALTPIATAKADIELTPPNRPANRPTVSHSPQPRKSFQAGGQDRRASACRVITQAHLIKARDHRAATPAQARNFLDAMRGLFKWAKKAKHVSIDPTEGVENPKRKRAPASSNGPRPMPSHTTNAGRSARASGSGATSYSTPACAVAMPSGLASACA
jgi:hypothetical protein